MERFLEIDSLKEIFRGDDLVGGLQEYTERIRLLHHQYLEARLALASIPDGRFSIKEMLRFADDAEYLATQYTNPLVIERIEELSVEEVPSRQVVQDALSLAGTIFEFLGDIASLYESQNSFNKTGVLWSVEALEIELDEQSAPTVRLGRAAFLYLKAALCYGLGVYEARTHVILKRLLSNINITDEPLSITNYQQWADYTVCALVSSNLEKLLNARFLLVERIKLIKDQLRQTEPLFIQQNKISFRKKEELYLSVSLIEASLSGAEGILRGDLNKVTEAQSKLQEAIKSAYDLGDFDLIWIIRTVEKVLAKKWADSPWVRLTGIINRQTYIRKLIDDGVITLWSSQIAALEMRSKLGELKGGYLDERIKKVVIHMPTSAGKTLLAELAIAQQSFSEMGKKCIYVAPSRALCDQVAADLSNRLSKFGVHVTSMVSDNEFTAYEDILFDLSSVVVLTPEKLDYLYRQSNSFVLNTGLFIFDELHSIGKEDRGWTYEELISLLLQHPQTCNSKMMFISAVMPNHLTVQEWVDPEKLSDTVSELWQPTRVLKGAISFNFIRPQKTQREITLQGDLIYVRHKSDLNSPLRINRFIQSKQALKIEKSILKRDSKKSDDEIKHAAYAANRFAALGPVLVYCPRRVDAVQFCKTALELKISIPPLKQEADQQYRELIEFIKDRLPPDHLLIDSLSRRIAFHHAGLPADVRNEIEHAFRQGWIYILAATTTLVEGVNLPVKTLVLADYCMNRRWDPLSKGWVKHNKLSKSDFRNMAGRAGRALFETEGQVVFIQSIIGYPYSISDTEFMDYLALEPDSSELNITSALANDTVLTTLSRLVDQVDNGKISEQQMIFGENDSSSSLRHIKKLISKLHTFSLLVQEQGLVDDSEASFFHLCGGTFFSKQRPDLGPQIVGAFSHRSARAIKKLINQSERTLFSQTGLKLPTCRTLLSRVRDYWQLKNKDADIFSQVSLNHDDLVQIAAIIFDLEDSDVDPQEVTLAREGKGSRTSKRIEGEKNFFAEWILEHETHSLIEKYFSVIKDPTWRAEQFINYTQETFGYKVPWVLSAFLIFSRSIVNDAGIDLSATPFGRELFLLPAYVKFGVNTPSAALFSTLGISPSKLAQRLGTLYEEQNIDEKYNYPKMLRWLFTVEPATLRETLASSYIRRLSRILSSLKPLNDELLSKEDENIWEVTFPIAGWQYYGGDKYLNILREGEKLVLKHEFNNEYDPNAVAILTESGIQLGYVPRHLAPEVAAHLRIREIEATINKISLDKPIFERVQIYCLANL